MAPKSCAKVSGLAPQAASLPWRTFNTPFRVLRQKSTGLVHIGHTEPPFNSNLSKYPQGEPEDILLLAPQKGFFVIVDNKNYRNHKSDEKHNQCILPGQTWKVFSASRLLPSASPCLNTELDILRLLEIRKDKTRHDTRECTLYEWNSELIVFFTFKNILLPQSHAHFIVRSNGENWLEPRIAPTRSCVR